MVEEGGESLVVLWLLVALGESDDARLGTDALEPELTPLDGLAELVVDDSCELGTDCCDDGRLSDDRGLLSLDPLTIEPDECPLSETLLLNPDDGPDECSEDARLGESADDPESLRDEGTLLSDDGLFDEVSEDSPDDLLLWEADDWPELGTFDLLPEEVTDD